VLQWASHGGVAVAAAWACRGGVARGGGSNAKEEGGEELLCDAWKLAGRRWRGEAAQSGGRAPLCRR